MYIKSKQLEEKSKVTVDSTHKAYIARAWTKELAFLGTNEKELEEKYILII